MKNTKYSIKKKTMLTSIITVGALTIGTFATLPALADPAKGLEIAEKRKNLDTGWGIQWQRWRCCLKTNKGRAAPA